MADVKASIIIIIIIIILAHQHKASRHKILQWKQSDHSDVYSVVKVLRKETVFPRCRATDSCWNKKLVSLGSSVTAVILRPNSCVSSTARWFHVPAVSIATIIIIITIIIIEKNM